MYLEFQIKDLVLYTGFSIVLGENVGGTYIRLLKKEEFSVLPMLFCV